MPRHLLKLKKQFIEEVIRSNGLNSTSTIHMSYTWNYIRFYWKANCHLWIWNDIIKIQVSILFQNHSSKGSVPLSLLYFVNDLLCIRIQCIKEYRSIAQRSLSRLCLPVEDPYGLILHKESRYVIYRCLLPFVGSYIMMQSMIIYTSMLVYLLII